MTTDSTATVVARPEPRHVVLADEADARIRDASRAVEELEAVLCRVEAEVEAAEERAEDAPDGLDLPESAQLTLRLIDDLLSADRERMRDRLSERYAWAGDRLIEATAEAQAIVNDAIADLDHASGDSDEVRTGRGSLHELVFDLQRPIASPVPAVADDPGEPVSESGAAAAESDDGLDAEPLSAAAHGDDSVAAADGEDAPQGASVTDVPLPPLQSAAAVDDLVTSAVQAVVRALTDSARDAERPAAREAASPYSVLRGLTESASSAVTPPHPPSAETYWTALGALAEPRADVRPPAALAAGRSGPSAPAEALPREDGAIALADGVDAADDDGISPRSEDFWGDEVQAAESRSSRFRPRDLVISMLVLVTVVILALAVIG